MLEPGLKPDDEFSGREAFALADASLYGDWFGCAKRGDDLGGASPIKGEEEGSVMGGDTGSRIGLAEGPGLEAVKGLL